MGLDVYAGSFTRYYAGDWETVVQKAGREQGFEVQMVRANDDEDAITDPDVVRPGIVLWRDQLTQALGDNIDKPLDWDESPAAPYFTDKPAWGCYGSLLLWAAYAEHPKLKRPDECVEEWSEDPAYRYSSNPDFKSAYPQLLRDVELWLPVDFPFTFGAPDPVGNDVYIGSSVELARQLEALNRQTWNADEAAFADWRREGADHLAPLETGARFAFAIMLDLARAAVQHRLNLKLDY